MVLLILFLLPTPSAKAEKLWYKDDIEKDARQHTKLRKDQFLTNVIKGGCRITFRKPYWGTMTLKRRNRNPYISALRTKLRFPFAGRVAVRKEVHSDHNHFYATIPKNMERACNKYEWLVMDFVFEGKKYTKITFVLNKVVYENLHVDKSIISKTEIENMLMNQ